MQDSSTDETISIAAREMQKRGAKARWAKYSPEAKSQYMASLARRPRQGRKAAQRGVTLNRNALRAFRRQFAPVWHPSKIVRLRRALNLPQDLMSAVLGSSREVVKRWESGHQLPTRAAQRLIWLLERSIQGRPVTLEALLTWADD